MSLFLLGCSHLVTLLFTIQAIGTGAFERISGSNLVSPYTFNPPNATLYGKVISFRLTVSNAVGSGNVALCDV